MRRALVVTAAALLGACSCPRPLCAQWLIVPVRAEAWTVGAYVVDVTAGTTSIHCTITVADDDVGPRPGDVACTGGAGVVVDELLLDTAEQEDPDHVELRVVTGAGDDTPEAASVLVRWEGGGAHATVIDEVRLLVWDDHPPPFGTCARGCFDAELALELPRVE